MMMVRVQVLKARERETKITAAEMATIDLLLAVNFDERQSEVELTHEGELLAEWHHAV